MLADDPAAWDVNGEFVGGSDIMTEMYQAGELQLRSRRTPACR